MGFDPFAFLKELGDTVEDDLKNFTEISLDRSLNYLLVVIACILLLALMVSMNNTSSVAAQLEPMSLTNARALCGFNGNFTQLVENRDWAQIINRSQAWNWTNST